MRQLNPGWSLVVKVVSIIFGLYYFVNAFFIMPYQYTYPLFLCFTHVLIFILYPFSKKEKAKGSPTFADLILIAITLAFSAYFISNFWWFVERAGLSRTPDLVMGVLAIVTSIEACRRVLGNSLPIIGIICLVYAYFGYLIPDQFILHHAPVNWRRIVMTLFSIEGLYGTVTQIYARFVLLFIIFGAVLEVSGLGDLIIKISMAIVGRFKGGVAKTAVISSALVGGVVGSGSANVAITGVFTIPMMKKNGFPNDIAGAVEAVSSSAGAIMPPVMGSAAFILAAYVGVTYREIVIISFLPAILFYLATYMQVHYISYKLNIKKTEASDIPDLKALLKKDWILLVPFVMIFALVIYGMTPFRAAAISTVTIFVICLVTKRAKPLQLLESFGQGTRSSLTISGTAGVCGILVTALTLVGFPLKFTSLAISLSGGNLLILIILCFVIAYIFGMGMAMVPAYIIISTIAAPALIGAGLTRLAAHMIIMWFCLASMWTPPVAISAFVASSIADANPFKIGFKSMPLGMGLYIIPFMFAYGNIITGSFWEIVFSAASASLALIAVSAAVVGYTRIKVPLPLRLFMVAAALLLIMENPLIVSIGALGFVIIFAYQHIKTRKMILSGTFQG